MQHYYWQEADAHTMRYLELDFMNKVHSSVILFLCSDDFNFTVLVVFQSVTAMLGAVASMRDVW